MHNQITIAAGSVDITPQRPVPLGGYARRLAPYEGIADPLEANALVIDGGSSKVVIVTTDLLYPGETLRNNLLKNLGLQGHQLFLCASHTHFAPMTAPAMPRLGVPDSEYVEYLTAQITGMVKAFVPQPPPPICTYHEGTLDHSINRRLICRRVTASGFNREAGFGPNPAGARDESVRVLKFARPNGEPLALLWNYACHATDCFNLRQVSAAYPGIVRTRLRAQFGDCPVLFFQGFAGDVRPPFIGIPIGIRGVARRVLRGPQFKDVPERTEREQWAGSLAATVLSVARKPGTNVTIGAPATRREQISGNVLATGGGNKSLFWHLIDCGGFRVAGINAEPVNEYRPLIQQYFTTPFLTVGYLDQTHCYLPIDRMIAERGYEVEGFRTLFNFDGHFKQGLQESVVASLLKALAQCGRSAETDRRGESVGRASTS
ncbi:MAG: hypothetical protein ACREQ4_02845 [Candidatus Binataceae bacterium]